MERAAIVVAVVVAILFAAAGAGAFHFNGMNFRWTGNAAPQVAVQPGKLDEAIYAAASVDIRDAAAIVRVTPEDRADIVVTIDNPGRTPMPVVALTAGTLTIDGRLQGRILNCRDDGGVDLLGYGGVSAGELPVITLRVPRAVDLGTDGAVTSQIAAAESVSLDNSGCGTANVADMTGAFQLDNSGSGDITAGAAASAELDLSGSGDVALGVVAGLLETDMAGSGTVQAASAGGLNADIAGSGEVNVAALNGPLSVDSAGSGDVTVGPGSAASARISLAGSSSVHAPSLAVQSAEVEIAGSGDVELGAVGDLDVEIMGSGGVRAASVSGRNRQSVMGSGDVTVGAH